VIVVLLAHACQNGLLGTPINQTQFLFGTMGNASATLHCDLVATLKFAPLACWTMSTA
jgi:hypothetical protein